MKNVEKFKELLEITLDEYSNYFITNDIDLCTDILEKLETKKEKLIKMYSELEEPKENVIKCKKYEIKEKNILNKFSTVKFIVSRIEHEIMTEVLEEKDGILITDDFIFIKEE